MIYVCAFLVFVCIIELLIILWLRNAKTKKMDIEPAIDFFRRMWGTFVIYVIATSIIGLFIASFIMKEEITLAKMNEWVSLVLGLVALIIGIISLFLSFYNVDQAYKTQEETTEIMRTMQKDIVERFKNLQIELEHKIDASSKETRDYSKELFEGNRKSSYEQPSGDNKWEISDNEEK